MKVIRNISLALITIFTMGFQQVQAQFSATESSTSIQQILGVQDLSEIISLHKGSPDSLTNHLKDSIMVHIRGPQGALFNGLQAERPSAPPKTFNVLKASQTAAINTDKLRQGTGPNKKTELIITIPGVRMGQGGWDLQPVQWTLGTTDHQPTFTQIKYLGGAKGYQIIFVYEEGLSESDEIDKEDDKNLMYHIDGHICMPNDPKCL